MTQKVDGHRVPVGGPLYLAEARYFQNELRKLGVSGRIRSDFSVGARTNRVHVVFVFPEDAKTAEFARKTFLDEDGDGELVRSCNDPPRKVQKGPLLFGVIGFVTGLRVGARLLNSAWLGALLASVLAFVAFSAAHFAGRSRLQGNSVGDPKKEPRGGP